MKLAEALQERADLNYKISDLELRLTQNSLVQEGEAPNENPEELLKTMCLINYLKCRYNKTFCIKMIFAIHD